MKSHTGREGLSNTKVGTERKRSSIQYKSWNGAKEKVYPIQKLERSEREGLSNTKVGTERNLSVIMDLHSKKLDVLNKFSGNMLTTESLPSKIT